jgi:hypothetical protein
LTGFGIDKFWYGSSWRAEGAIQAEEASAKVVLEVLGSYNDVKAVGMVRKRDSMVGHLVGSPRSRGKEQNLPYAAAERLRELLVNLEAKIDSGVGRHGDYYPEYGGKWKSLEGK